MYNLPEKEDIQRIIKYNVGAFVTSVNESRLIIIKEFDRSNYSKSLYMDIADDIDRKHSRLIIEVRAMLINTAHTLQMPAEILSEWARDGLYESCFVVTSIIPPNGQFEQYQKVLSGYTEVFERRIEQALRDVEIGYMDGAFAAGPFMPTEKIADPASIMPPKPTKAIGGRPKAIWWDDLWIEICRGLYVGELQPKSQADLARAMADWVGSTQNEHPSESTIRERAKKLWEAIDREN